MLAHVIDNNKKNPKNILSIISFNDKIKDETRAVKSNLSIDDNSCYNIENLMMTTQIPAKIVSLEFYESSGYLCIGY